MCVLTTSHCTWALTEFERINQSLTMRQKAAHQRNSRYDFPFPSPHCKMLLNSVCWIWGKKDNVKCNEVTLENFSRLTCVVFNYGLGQAETVKNPPAMEESRVRSLGPGRSPGEGNGNPLQHSCLGNLMDGGAWQAAVQGVTKSRKRLSNLHTHTLTHSKWA